jgi:ubiquinone/menaquinone biosynthesis C-methylase UbiE
MWFDRQAEQFDDAAGIGPEVGGCIARVIVELAGCGSDDVILDIGAGTGTIGVHFAEQSRRYVGLDRSERMLAVFRRKLERLPGTVQLVQADAETAWPIGDGAVSVVFASRVVHHLPIQHFIQEVWRVCRPGGHLLLGSVTRDADSLPSRLQRYKRMLLAQHGIVGRDGGQAIQQVVDGCCRRGATALPAMTAAHWVRTATARQFLTAWEGKPRLTSSASGNELEAEQRLGIVGALTDWARQEFGGLEKPHAFSEAYALQGVRLPQRREGRGEGAGPNRMKNEERRTEN